MNKETLSTSEKEIPKHRNALSEKYKQEDKKIVNTGCGKLNHLY